VAKLFSPFLFTQTKMVWQHKRVILAMSLQMVTTNNMTNLSALSVITEGFAACSMYRIGTDLWYGVVGLA